MATYFTPHDGYVCECGLCDGDSDSDGSDCICSGVAMYHKCLNCMDKGCKGCRPYYCTRSVADLEMKERKEKEEIEKFTGLLLKGNYWENEAAGC